MIKIEWLQTLQDVTRLGNFSAVAVERGVSAMAISKQITALEQKIAEPVFNRSSRRMVLTETGRLLVDRSQRLLSEHSAIDDWLTDRHGEPAGELSVLVSEEPILRHSLTPWVGEFLQLYPKVSLNIQMMTDLSQVPTADVYWGMSKYIGDYMPGLKRMTLARTGFGIYGSEAYLAQYGVPTTPTDLGGHFVIGNTHNAPQNSLVVRGGRDFNDGFLEGVYLPTKVVTAVGGEEFAAQGLGLINGATSMVNHAQSPWDRLIPVLEDYWVTGFDAYAYYHQTKIDQPKVRAFLDFFYEKRTQWLVNPVP